MKKKPMLEKTFQAKVTSWLKDNGIPYYKTTGGLMTGSNGVHYVMNSGFPDLMIFQNGKIILIELKTDSKTSKLRKTQVKRFTELDNQDIKVFVLRPATWKIFKLNYEEFNDVFIAAFDTLSTWKEDIEHYGKQK